MLDHRVEELTKLRVSLLETFGETGVHPRLFGAGEISVVQVPVVADLRLGGHSSGGPGGGRAAVVAESVEWQCTSVSDSSCPPKPR